jgi:hypothetical protein
MVGHVLSEPPFLFVRELASIWEGLFPIRTPGWVSVEFRMPAFVKVNAIHALTCRMPLIGNQFEIMSRHGFIHRNTLTVINAKAIVVLTFRILYFANSPESANLSPIGPIPSGSSGYDTQIRAPIKYPLSASIGAV